MLSILILLGLAACGKGSWLPPYQERFAELSNRMTWGLTLARETNRAQHNFLRQDILVEIAEGIVALRRIRYETNQKLNMYKARDGADKECLKSVEESLDSLVVKAEQFVQLCVAELDQALRWDADVRFYPLVKHLQRESTYAVTTTLDALSEWNPLVNRVELESRLDAEMDHFTEDWIIGQSNLDEELEQHGELTERVVSKINECSDGMVAILPQNIENIMYYAENYCLAPN